MKNHKSIYTVLILSIFGLIACNIEKVNTKSTNLTTPVLYNNISNIDSTNTADLFRNIYFSDHNLTTLIDSALKNNQELNIILKEIEISKNEIRARKGEYLPFVGFKGGLGLEKSGKFTRNGAVDENLDIQPGKRFPVPLTDNMIGVYASWELDVWNKLHNAKKSAVAKYLASIEGKNFMVTNLVADIAENYYKLMALDNLLDIIQTNIKIQDNAYQIIKQQKEAGKVTQLAVNRFEAQVLNTQNRQYEIIQQIVETENRINFLVGRYPQTITRNSTAFNDLKIDTTYMGYPSQLLENRPDIKQAELEIISANLDIKTAKANFYPSFRIQSGLGFQALTPKLLLSPESILYNLAGELVAPLINRNAIRTVYLNANAKQIQAVYNYERSILNAYIEVVNELSKVENYKKSYQTKLKEVSILTQSIDISNSLFNSARADYMEVLLTQREALESKVDLVEIRLLQMQAQVNIYRALGGGWR